MKTKNLKKISLSLIKQFRQIDNFIKLIVIKIFMKEIIFRHKFLTLKEIISKKIIFKSYRT